MSTLRLLSLGLIFFITSSCDNATTVSPGQTDLASTVVFSTINDWSFDTGGDLFASPTIADGIAYIGNLNGDFYAVDLLGTEIWHYAGTSPIRSEAVIADGLVIFTAENRLFALNITDGSLVWKHESQEAKTLPYRVQFDIWDLKDSSPLLHDNIAYYGDQFGSLFGIDISSGLEVFDFKTATEQRIRVKPAISDGLIYFGDGGGTIYAVDLENKFVKWSFETLLEVAELGGAIIGEIKIDLNRVYFGLQNTVLYALQKNTGEVEWTFENQTAWMTGIPLINNGLIYIGENFTNRLFARDQLTGGQEWVYNSLQQIYSAPVIAGDKLILLTTDPSSLGNETIGDGRLHLLDQTGEAVRISNLPGSAYSSPKIVNNNLYFGCKDGKLYAVNLTKLLAE